MPRCASAWRFIFDKISTKIQQVRPKIRIKNFTIFTSISKKFFEESSFEKPPLFIEILNLFNKLFKISKITLIFYHKKKNQIAT